MALKFKSYLSVILMLSSALLIISCKEETTTTVSSNPAVGVVDDTAGFYVRAYDEGTYTYYPHVNGDFSTSCVADTGDDIDCVIEANELDLFMNGIKFQFNVPSTMCTYFWFKPYTYFKYKPGRGPSEVRVHTDQNGTVGFDCNANGTVGDAGVCTGGGDEPIGDALNYIDGNPFCYAPLTTTTVPYDSITNDITDADLAAITSISALGYDYSDVGGPNCCTGTYTYTRCTWDPSVPGYTCDSTVGQKWDGKASNCLSGPGASSSWPYKDNDGFPFAEIKYVSGTGLNDTFAVKAPYDLKLNSNIYVANFESLWEPLTPQTQLAATFMAVSASGWDAATGSPYAGLTQPAYEFQCLDQAFEVKARINTYIREWNTKAEYDKKADPDDVPPGDPDVSGADSGGAGVGQDDDINDWTDITDIFPAKDE